MTKISQLSSIGDSLAVNDQFLIRDVDDATTPNKSVTVSGITRALDVGSATAPAIAFASDKNTGIYSPGADQVAISTNGAERLRVTTTGLGIGTSSIRGTSLLDARGDISFGSNANYYGLLSYNAATGHIETTSSDGGFKWIRASGPATSMTLDSSGRLGIGTTSPQNALVVSNGGAAGIEISPTNFSGNPLIVSYNRSGAAYTQLTLDGATNVFAISGTERARITSSGQWLVGTSASRTVCGQTPQVQLEGLNVNQSTLGLSQNANDANSPLILFGKSRATTLGGSDIVAANDRLGGIRFSGGDGVNLTSIAASIETFVDGTPGASDMPGRLVFSTTADGASSPTERLRITSAGLVGVGTSAPGGPLDLAFTNATVYSSATSANNAFAAINSSATTGSFASISLSSRNTGNAGCTVNLLGISTSTNNASDFAIQQRTTAGAYRENLRITHDGKVGIGSTAPTRNFVLNGTGVTYLKIAESSLGEAVTDGFDLMLDSSATAYVWNRENGPVAFGSNNLERLRITSAGLVGIGTSSPAKLLDIYGDSGLIVRSTNRNATETPIFIGGGDSSQRKLALIGKPVGTFGRQDLLICSNNAEDSTDVTSANAVVTVKSTGAVGIGTTSPGYLLDVRRSSAGDVVAFTGSTDGGRPLKFVSADNGIFLGAQWTRDIGSGSGIHAWAINGTERARIDSAGRLLVGTSSAVTPYSGILSQIHNGDLTVNTFAGNTTGYYGFSFVKSRGTGTSNVIVQNNDNVGATRFWAADGTNYIEAASIRCDIDGTPGTNDMPGRLVFSTTADGASSPTERMRINAAGGFKFSDTGTYTSATDAKAEFRQSANVEGLSIRSTNASLTSVVLLVRADRNASGGEYNFISAGVTGVDTRFIVANDGDVTNTNNSYGGISDIKLKENIIDATSQWDDIKALKVRKYNFKEGQAHTQIGLIAQEVELVSPGLVSESPDRDEKGNNLGTTTKSVNYSVLYMKAVKALQEAMLRIEQLEADVAALKA